MTIYSTVENAVNLVVEVLESSHSTFDTNSIRNRVYSWYSNSDVADPQILAACALMGCDYYPGATYTEMLHARDLWFPQDGEYAIWEIEAAQYDMLWQ